MDVDAKIYHNRNVTRAAFCAMTILAGGYRGYCTANGIPASELFFYVPFIAQIGHEAAVHALRSRDAVDGFLAGGVFGALLSGLESAVGYYAGYYFGKNA